MENSERCSLLHYARLSLCLGTEMTTITTESTAHPSFYQNVLMEKRGLWIKSNVCRVLVLAWAQMLAGWLPDVACRERTGVGMGGAADPRTQLRRWRRGSFFLLQVRLWGGSTNCCRSAAQQQQACENFLFNLLSSQSSRSCNLIQK